MKKFFTGILATLACLACFTACGKKDKDNDKDRPIDGVVNFLETKYDRELTDGNNVVVTNLYAGGYTIVWSLNVTEGVSLEVGDETTKVIVSPTLAEELAYTLTGTITASDGSTATISFDLVATPNNMAPAPIKALPVENTVYKFYVYHVAKEYDCYATGNEANKDYYLATAKTYEEGTEVYAETAEGGVKLYINRTENDQKVKYYLNIVEVQNGDKTYVNSLYQTEAEHAPSVWTYDEELKTVVVTINSKKWYLGCNSGFDTLQALNGTDKDKYAGALVEMVDKSTLGETTKIEQTLKELSYAPVYVGDYTEALPAAGKSYSDAAISWAVKAGESNASIENNTLTLTNPSANVTVTLTATVSMGTTSETKDITFTLIPNTQESIIATAATLSNGEKFGNAVSLTGKVLGFESVYSEQHGNVTVDLLLNDNQTVVGAYRLTGHKDLELASVTLGYTLEVSGIITKNNGYVRFDQGCSIASFEAGTEADLPAAPQTTDKEIVDAAYALEQKEFLPHRYTLTGKVTAITDAYNANNGNVSVNIEVEGKTIGCYRMIGDEIANVKVGDTVTVSGLLTRQNSSTVQFKTGCTLDALEAGAETPAPNAPAADSLLTLPKAIEFGNTFDKDAYSTDKYYVEGTITEFYGDKGTTYGNVYIADADGNQFLIYGLLNEDGTVKYSEMETKPTVGDYIKVYGIIGKYDEAQMKNGWVVAHTPVVKTDADKVNEVLDEISIATVYSDAATATLPTTDKTHTTATITWAISGTGATLDGANLTVSAPSAAATFTLTATATVGDASNTKEFTVSLITNTKEAIVAAATALKSGESFGNSTTLTGTVSTIVSAYNSTYKNITVNMVIEGTETTIQAYRLKGGETLAVGTTITVTGIIKNYGGMLEFDAGCTYVEGDGSVVLTPAEIVDAAYALADGATLGNYTLTGVISKIDTAWSAQNNNITVSIIIDGKEDMPIQCFRLKGTGADTLAVGNTITVTGTISKYYTGVVQFGAGSTLDKVDTEAAVSDIAKVIIEGNTLVVPSKVEEAGSATLATVGATYNNVSIAWASDNACAVVEGGNVTFTLPDTATSVTLTATITCGEVVKTFTFVISVYAKPVAGQTTATFDFKSKLKPTDAHQTLLDAPITVDGVTLSIVNNGGTSGSIPQINKNGYFQLYASDSATFTVKNAKILSVAITFTNTEKYPIQNFTVDTAGYTATTDGDIVTIAPDADGAVSITISNDNTKQYQISSIVIIYEAVV